YDFYLVSQSVRQGTVSPTSYNVISDNIGLDPDKLQRLTYKLTHLYYNWSFVSLLTSKCTVVKTTHHKETIVIIMCGLSNVLNSSSSTKCNHFNLEVVLVSPCLWNRVQFVCQRPANTLTSMAFLVGQALHRSPNVQLDDYLYFL
ncbi:unnamed protein product, partial [Timema podura]|nr:unnamed protein product [Timema podura]